MDVPVLALCTGFITSFSRGERSAIAKIPVQGRVRIGFAGLEGDEQADKLHHGRRDKALHHYPADHYPRWGRDAPDHPLLNLPGAFGENISTWGLLEDEVCIGDRFRCGTALLEISQGREPCWKQADRMQWNILPKLMTRERRCGWYYRVIEEGEAQEGDVIRLEARVLPDWSVERVFGLLIAGDHVHEPESLPLLRDMDLLFEGWRQRAADLMAARK